MDTGLHRPKSLPYSTNHHSKIQKKRFDNRSLHINHFWKLKGSEPWIQDCTDLKVYPTLQTTTQKFRKSDLTTDLFLNHNLKLFF